MCGFAGVVDFGPREVDRRLLESMAQTIMHRGPDERGLSVDGPCGLAHRRLSIVDVSASHQPMSLPGCAITLAYNGELYNHLDLRQPLTRGGTKFVTNGDTEVLLRCVAEDWTESLARFDGMFAFAAWDAAHRRLLLARDPIGEKPLFFAIPRPNLIVFGSEMKAVVTHPEVARELDHDAIRQLIRFRTVYGARTTYVGVRQLPPGHFLEFDKTGGRVARYFDLVECAMAARRTNAGMSRDALIRHGRELLTTAVRERLMADVPLGVFLSGGLDSSLIAAIVRRLRPEGTLKTFSVGFEGDDNSETGHARTVANVLGSDHLELHVGPAAFKARLTALSQFRDGPVSEPADVAIAALSQNAKQYVKVVLSGEGADEVFCGYPKYILASLPAAFRWPFVKIGAERAARAAALIGVDHRRALVVTRSLTMRQERDRLTQWFSYFDRQHLTNLFPGLAWNDDTWCNTVVDQDEILARSGGFTPVGRMQLVDCLTWLPGNMLERGDRMTMSEGLELRPPFLDRQLVAFGLALPDRMKVKGRCTKWIVREWAKSELPPSIYRRPKWGFRVPLAKWFRSELRDLLFDRLSDAHGLCASFGDRARIQKLLQEHDRGIADHNLALWGLLALETWYSTVRGTCALKPLHSHDGEAGRTAHKGIAFC